MFKGLPIPYITLIDDETGKPDFRVTDEVNRMEVMFNGWCQLCGQQLGKYIFFVGGTEAAKANQYFEPGTHLDCLLYAMQVCPFIVGRIEHADFEKVAKAHPDLTVKADPTFSSVRNPLWVIKKAEDYNYARTPDGTILLIPKTIKETKPLCPDKMTAQDWEDVRGILE